MVQPSFLGGGHKVNRSTTVGGLIVSYHVRDNDRFRWRATRADCVTIGHMQPDLKRDDSVLMRNANRPMFENSRVASFSLTTRYWLQ